MPLIPMLIGDPAAVPYGDFSIEEPNMTRLWWLSIATGGNASYITIRTGGAGPEGVIRWQMEVPANTAFHMPFPKPIPLERGMYINASKAAIIHYGATE